jgi:transcriptional regulator with XRE-family HTH domain
MSMDELLKRISAEQLDNDGTARRPSRDLLAMLIRMGRGMRGWKAQTLADFASVSLSTVERAERGDKVGDAALDAIATALGYEPGDFTRERTPLSPAEAQAAIVRDWGALVAVNVAPLVKEAQIRALSRCHAILKMGRGHSAESCDALDELAEWLDLIAFVRSNLTPSKEPKRLRELYRGALDCVARLRATGMNVIAGVWPDPRPGIPDFTVAVLAISPRALDPGAAKRPCVIIDRRDIAGLAI